MSLQIPQMVPQALSQQNNGPHSNPPTPQSQTPTTPGLHGGPSTPTGHPLVGGQSQTPSPAQTVMFTGQNLPPHSVAGAFNNQSQMVLMQGHPPQPQGHPSHSHANVAHVSQGHGMPVIQTNTTPLVMQQQQHYQQNQPSR